MVYEDETEDIVERIGKSLVMSKTFLVNVATALVGVATYLSATDLVSQYPKVATALATVVAIGNIVLRLATNKPIDRVFPGKPE